MNGGNRFGRREARAGVEDGYRGRLGWRVALGRRVGKVTEVGRGGCR